MDVILQRLRQQVLDAASARTPLRLRGGGSKDWYGQDLRGAVCDTRPYSGIIAYEPTELVITARCGTPLAEIEAALAEQNQMLAFEPPYFGAHSTIGGVVASGLSGPRRASAGSVRDFLLGATLLDGQGRVLHFGGRVMKNVAGYDISRMLAGSLGTLGLILDMSLKVLPKPCAETSLRLGMEQAQALSSLNQWAGQPLPISASLWCDGELTLRLSGAAAAVEGACIRLGGDALDAHEASAFWQAAREQTHPFFTDPQADTGLWRLSLPSAAAVSPLPRAQLIEWGGAQRWIRSDPNADPIAEAMMMRIAAAGQVGHASLFRGGAKKVGVFQALAPAVDRIHQNLKAAFDPAGIFNPGRMYHHF
jgi:glycolate oxidase FAD binding subunit